MRPLHESACQKRHDNDDSASNITYAKQEVTLSRIKVSVQHAYVLPILQERAICSTYPTVSSISPFSPSLQYDDQPSNVTSESKRQ
jgi:hypothetical protein